ncbi:MAG: hypothetical protein ACLPVY_26655 [Acidimicrobiia bacterium]
MHKMLVVFVAGVAALGLTDCGGSKSPKSTPTTPATARPARSGTSSPSTRHGLAAYLKCLSQHGVNVKQAATAKATGGAGAELKKDSHYATAEPICKHLLPT